MRTPATAPTLAPLEWVALGGVVAVGVGSWLSPDRIADGPVICPFRLLTGLPCPTCGMTRSWVHALHGQWSDSWGSNAFGLLLLVATLATALVVGWARVRGSAPPRLDALLRRPVSIAVLAAWGAFGLLRMASSAW